MREHAPEFHGIVIAEGLDEPSVINRLRVYRAEITQEGAPLDYEGSLGRWHLYWVEVDEEMIREVQRHTGRGWYSHFWQGDRLVVVYNDATFEVGRRDKSSWAAAIEHGKQQGIPRDELDFISDD
jgi:hypothetical protein